MYPCIGQTISLNRNITLQQRDNPTLPTPFLCAFSYCSNLEEFQFLIKSLVQSKNIEVSISDRIDSIAGVPREDYELFNQVIGRIKAGDFTDIDITDVNLVVTEKGWKRTNEIENRTSSEKSENSFLLPCGFDPSMNAL